MVKKASSQQAENIVLDYLRTAAQENNPIPFDFETIAETTGFSISTIYRVVHALEEQGYIRVDKAAYKQKPNIWVFDDNSGVRDLWENKLHDLEEAVNQLNVLIKGLRGALKNLVHENIELRQTIAAKDKEIKDTKSKLDTLREIL